MKILYVTDMHGDRRKFEQALQLAIDWYLNGRGLRERKFMYLCHCADKLAIAGFPEHSALMMESAGKFMLKTAQDGRHDREWQEGFRQASSYWLQAGNPEESENSALMAAGMALGLKLQLPMFPDESGGRHVMPLWTVATNLAAAGKFQAAADTYNRVAEEMALFKDDYGMAVICVHAAGTYAHLDLWSDVVARLEYAITLFDKHSSLINNHRIQFNANFMAGIGYLHVEPEPQFDNAILRLKLMKMIGGD